MESFSEKSMMSFSTVSKSAQVSLEQSDLDGGVIPAVPGHGQQQHPWFAAPGLHQPSPFNARRPALAPGARASQSGRPGNPVGRMVSPPRPSRSGNRRDRRTRNRSPGRWRVVRQSPARPAPGWLRGGHGGHRPPPGANSSARPRPWGSPSNSAPGRNPVPREQRGGLPRIFQRIDRVYGQAERQIFPPLPPAGRRQVAGQHRQVGARYGAFVSHLRFDAQRYPAREAQGFEQFDKIGETNPAGRSGPTGAGIPGGGPPACAALKDVRPARFPVAASNPYSDLPGRCARCRGRSRNPRPTGRLVDSYPDTGRRVAAHRPSSLCEPRRTSCSTASSGLR